MNILHLVNNNDCIAVLKALRCFGNAQLLAQELFEKTKTLSPEIIHTLTPNYLEKHSHDSLNTIQGQFKELFEHRKKLQQYLKLHNYPVLDRAIHIPNINLHNTILLSKKLTEDDPFQHFVSLRKKDAIVFTTEEKFFDAKRTIAETTNKPINTLRDISSENSPVIFAGMTTPQRTAETITQISEYLDNLQINEQKNDSWAPSY